MERPSKSFFRPIIPNVFEEKLELPMKFARMYGQELKEKCQLYLPNGSSWKVGVVKGPQAGVIWFDQGWSHFVKKNSVSIGMFLVFDYLGSSKFQVQILKVPAAVEIVNVEDEASDNDDDDTDSVQILKSGSEGRQVKRKSVNQTVDEDGDRAVLKDLQERRIIVSKQFKCTLCKMSSESKKALQAAIAAVAEQPEYVPCFIAVMQPHNLTPRIQLNLPAQFLHEHMGGGDCKESVTLRCGGKSWVAKTVPRAGGGAFIYKGWSELVEFEDLKEGDVCLFQKEMTLDGIALKVSIFRASQFKG